MIDLGVTVFLWGFSFALAKRALNDLSPFELVTLRLALGAATGFVINRFLPISKPVRNVRTAFLIGLFEFAGTYIFYTWSLMYLPSGVVGTLTLLTPVFTYAVSLAFGVSSISWQAGLAILISIFGAGFCLPIEKIFSNFNLTSPALLGCLLILFSNFLFAVGNVIITKTESRGQWSQKLTYQGQAFGALIALIMCFIFPRGDYNRFLNPTVWFLPFYLGVVATGIGFFLWNRGVQKVSATRASLVGNFKAPISLLWGFILLGEPVTWKLFAGLILLMLATQILPKGINKPNNSIRGTN